jgi:hypothetical protein
LCPLRALVWYLLGGHTHPESQDVAYVGARLGRLRTRLQGCDIVAQRDEHSGASGRYTISVQSIPILVLTLALIIQLLLACPALHG